MNYPRVLIIGQTFNLHSGGGITLSNLFRNWPNEKIVIVSSEINEDWSICSKQYVIGFNETKKVWPISLFQDNRKSVVISGHNEDVRFYKNGMVTGSNHASKAIFKKLIKDILNFFGIFHFFEKIKLTDSLTGLIEDFKPDIVYSQLASLPLINLVHEIHVKHKVPIAMHIMDDWPSFIAKEGLLGFYWNWKTRRAFKSLVKESSVHLSISNAMSEQYEKLHGVRWEAIHNPVNLEQPKTVNLQQRVDDSYTKFLYRGRVGKGIEMSLIYLVQSIENLLKEGYKYKIQLGIQENDFSRMHFNTYSCTELLPRLPYDEVQGSLCLADVLIIAYDFDDVSNISMRFSMPTKVTEYMASGVPILVFAPRNFAVTKYALNEKWGFVVDTEDETLLSNALNRLVKDQVLRMQLVINARNTVEKFHDENDIRVKFLNALIKGYSG